MGLNREEAGDGGAVERKQIFRSEEVERQIFADGGATQKAAAGSRSSEAEGDLFVSEVQGGGSGILWPRALTRRHKIMCQLPLTRHLDQKMEAEDEKNMEELSLDPSAVSEPLHMCDSKCRTKGFKFFEIAAIVS